MDARILIASNGTNETESCRNLLQDEFETIFLSTEADAAVEDFEAAKPNVLILAFEELEKAERYYLGLYRLCETVHIQIHRTIILCTKDNVRDIYRLCRKEHFDDYVLFWPLTHDAPRLAMAVHQAVRALDNPSDVHALRRKMAVHIERIAELEATVDREVTDYEAHADAAGESLRKGESQVGSAIDRFESSIFDGELANAVEIKEPSTLRNALGRLKAEGVQQSFRSISQSIEPMQRWAGSLKRDLGPQLESARSLIEISGSRRTLILVVDDDELQHKVLAAMLRDHSMELVFASSGVDGLAALRKYRPDLILMDYEMPQFNGLEVVLRLKSSEKFASIPIMMATGMSDRKIVAASVKAGAEDFIIKPFAREVLLTKMAKLLGKLPVCQPESIH
ncbi:MAG: CheY-like chemotaxis protein [Gammaproteobacteria bacterium]|jgi:CheY-like chemotaxis protein